MFPDRHIVDDHSVWDYVKLMIHIKTSDRDDDDGFEQFLRHQLDDWKVGGCLRAWGGW